MAQTFKKGDVVQLKSGGPHMTVMGEASADHLWCTWFAGAKNERKTFPVETLMPAPEKEKAKK